MKETTEVVNMEKGGLYILYDRLAEKLAKCSEYPNDRLAELVCENKLTFPDYIKAGDYSLIRIGTREGLTVTPIEPYTVWRYKPKEMKTDEVK